MKTKKKNFKWPLNKHLLVSDNLLCVDLYSAIRAQRDIKNPRYNKWVGWAHPAGPTSLEWPLGGQSLAPNCLWLMHHHYLPIPQDPKYYIGARRFRYVHTLPPWYGLPYRGLKMVHLITGQIKPKGLPNTVSFLNKFRGQFSSIGSTGGSFLLHLTQYGSVVS